MSIKKIVTLSLLLFVAASIVVLTVKSLRAPFSGDGIPVAEGVVVYYLHTKERCPDCITMEHCAKTAVHDGFQEQLEDGTLVWRVADQSEPGMAALGKICGSVASVVLVRVQSVKLDYIGSRDGGPEEYTEYVREEIEKFIRADKKEPIDSTSDPGGGEQTPGVETMPLPGEMIPLPGETVPLPGETIPLPGQ